METIGIYKAIFENDEDGFAIINNSTGFFVDVNASFCRITEKEKSFLLSGNDVTAVVPPEIFEADFDDYRKVLKGKSKDFLRFYGYRKPDRSYIYLKVKVKPIESTGNAYSFIAVEDMSETKYAQEKLKETEQHFQHLFDCTPVGLWEEDFSDVVEYLEKLELLNKPAEEVSDFLEKHPEHIAACAGLVKVIDINQSVLRQYQFSSKEEFMKGVNNVIVQTPKVLNAAKNFLVAICTNESTSIQESEGLTSTGEKVDLQLVWSVTPEAQKKRYNRVILASTDITEIKKTQRALEEASSRIETIINTIDGIVWTADAEDYRFTFISKKVEEVTGYPRDMFIGRDIFEVGSDFYHNESLVKEFRERVTNGIPDTLEYQITSKSGEVRWLQNSVSFIKNGDDIQLVLGILIDITAIKKSRGDLNESMRILAEQNSRLMNFSYIVSHNLRSHSSNIISLCELISRSQDEKEKEGYRELLEDVANLLHNTMEGLNEVTNIHAAISVPKEKLNLREYINRCNYILSDRIADRGVDFVNNVDESVTVFYNKAYLESILLNFISNSINYSHAERKPLVQLDFFDDGKDRMLTITDNGIGIDLKLNGNRMFGLFKTFSVNKKSRGIGLYISKNQIEAMGGSVSVESELGKGSVFKVYFK